MAAATCSSQDGGEASDSHWALKIGLKYYMAQCPILSNEKGVPPLLSCLEEDIPSLEILAGKELAQVNMWMSVQKTATNIHYDANENLLVVTAGRHHASRTPKVSLLYRLCRAH